MENSNISSGELREQDLWECGDGDQSPLTHSEYDKLYASGWGAWSFLFLCNQMSGDDSFFTCGEGTQVNGRLGSETLRGRGEGDWSKFVVKLYIISNHQTIFISLIAAGL